MKQKIEKINHYFEENTKECMAQKKALLADQRRDEANFWQIKANIYDIFKTILSVAGRTQNTEDEVWQFVSQKLAEMTATWKESGEKAEIHGDVEKARVEQIKVETAEEIRNTVERIWGETYD